MICFSKARADGASVGAVVSALTQSGRWEQLVLLAAEQRLDRRAANAAVKAMAQGQAWQEALRLRLGLKRSRDRI